MSFLLENGTILAGRYQVEKVLGQGGMGAVYLASDNRIPEKQWAVKELWDYGDPETRRLVQNQFKKEASILATLDHQNLPRITDFFVESDKEYLVMDLVEGKSLEEVIKEKSGPLDVDMVMNILDQLISALEYLHKQEPPVIFRDLKPANIMIAPENRVKLIDFGIARIFSVGKPKDTVILGTPGYAAPEQYGTSQSDVRSDIFGLGATAYYALTGKDPADNPFHFDSPSHLNDKVTPRLNNAILQCVQMDPGKRFSSMEELHKYLFDRAAVQTSELSPDLAGTREDETSPPEIQLEPGELKFGVVKRGSNYKKKFLIKGHVSRAVISADRPWVRVYPALLDGTDQEVGVTVYTRSLNNGGKYRGIISIKSQGREENMPLSVEIEPKHLSTVNYVLTIFFTLLSFAPVVGYLGFFFNLIAYYSTPRGERASLKIFYYVTVFMSLVWTITIGIIVALNYPQLFIR